MEVEDQKKFSTIGNYQLHQTLGAGYNAKVKLAYNTKDGQNYAMKIFKKTHTFEKNKESLIKEFNVMLGLKHPNLVNLIEKMDDAECQKPDGTSYKTMAIVLELCPKGEFFEYISNCGKFSQEECRTYYSQMLDALEYLHSQGVCHRDMKPENLLFDDNFNLKVADFGFATALAGKDGMGKLYTVLGTESYMAPEINSKQPYSGQAVDLFASAIILFIMMTGHPPFMKADPKDPYYRLLCTNRHQTFWNAHSKNKPQGFFSEELKNFFNSMFAQDPAQRPSLAEIRNHAWVKGQQKSIVDIQQGFTQRHQIIQAKIEKERLEKEKQRQMQQQQQQGANMIFAGAGKFRSGSDINTEFKGVETEFKLNENQRTMRKYEAKIPKITDLITPIDAPLLIRKLLKDYKKFCTSVSLNEKTMKLNCENLDENGMKTVFTVELLDFDNMICVDCKKEEGSSIDYYNLQQEVRKIVEGDEAQQEKKE